MYKKTVEFDRSIDPSETALAPYILVHTVDYVQCVCMCVCVCYQVQCVHVQLTDTQAWKYTC